MAGYDGISIDTLRNRGPTRAGLISGAPTAQPMCRCYTATIGRRVAQRCVFGCASGADHRHSSRGTRHNRRVCGLERPAVPMTTPTARDHAGFAEAGRTFPRAGCSCSRLVGKGEEPNGTSGRGAVAGAQGPASAPSRESRLGEIVDADGALVLETERDATPALDGSAQDVETSDVSAIPMGFSSARPRSVLSAASNHSQRLVVA